MDYWARKGISLDGIAKSNRRLINQISQEKMLSDLTIIEYQRKEKQDSSIIARFDKTLTNCSKAYNEQREVNVDLNKKVIKETTRKSNWRLVALIEAVLLAGIIFIAAS